MSKKTNLDTLIEGLFGKGEHPMQATWDDRDFTYRDIKRELSSIDPDVAKAIKKSAQVSFGKAMDEMIPKAKMAAEGAHGKEMSEAQFMVLSQKWLIYLLKESLVEDMEKL